MNNAEFKKWVRGLTKEEVAGAGCKVPAVVKAVCMVLAEYGDYKTGTGVQPAWTTVAAEACVSRTTAHKVRDWLVDNGVLVETGKTPPRKDCAGNITIYRFESVDRLTWTTEQNEHKPQLSTVDRQLQMTTEDGQLEDTDESTVVHLEQHSCPSSDLQLSIAEPQLSTLGGHDSTLDITIDNKEDNTGDNKMDDHSSLLESSRASASAATLIIEEEVPAVEEELSFDDIEWDIKGASADASPPPSLSKDSRPAFSTDTNSPIKTGWPQPDGWEPPDGRVTLYTDQGQPLFHVFNRLANGRKATKEQKDMAWKILYDNLRPNIRVYEQCSRALAEVGAVEEEW